MATAQITPDNDAILVEIFIAAPPARVFEALTDPVQTRQWWGDKNMYRMTESKADLRVGGKWLSQGVGVDGKTFSVEGEYVEVDPPHRLVYTWIASFAGYAKTVVHLDLEARDVHGMHASGTHRVGTGTLVKIRHTGFAGKAEAADGHRNGWIRVLGWMQLFVEKGQTLETRTA